MANLIRAYFLPAVLFLTACGGSSFDLGTGTGGVAGAMVDAGQEVGGIGGVAGAEGGSGEASVDADAIETCTGTEPCECVGTPGYRTCDGVCRQTTDDLCCGQLGSWVACCATGCGVDIAMLVGYLNYFKNHPNCVGASNCSFHGACSSSCPAPTDVDK